MVTEIVVSLLESYKVFFESSFNTYTPVGNWNIVG